MNVAKAAPQLPADDVIALGTTTESTPTVVGEPGPPQPIHDINGNDGTVHNSPEPATLTLLGLGGLGAWWQMRRRRKAA